MDRDSDFNTRNLVNCEMVKGNMAAFETDQIIYEGNFSKTVAL